MADVSMPHWIERETAHMKEVDDMKLREVFDGVTVVASVSGGVSGIHPGRMWLSMASGSDQAAARG